MFFCSSMHKKTGGRASLTSFGRCCSLQARILCFQVARMHQVDGQDIKSKFFIQLSLYFSVNSKRIIEIMENYENINECFQRNGDFWEKNGNNREQFENFMKVMDKKYKCKI